MFSLFYKSVVQKKIYFCTSVSLQFTEQVPVVVQSFFFLGSRDSDPIPRRTSGTMDTRPKSHCLPLDPPTTHTFVSTFGTRVLSLDLQPEVPSERIRTIPFGPLHRVSSSSESPRGSLSYLFI